MLTITEAKGSDLDTIRTMLVANRLTAADIDDPDIHFLTLNEGSRIMGCVALQRAGDFGLLRSLVVDDEMRGKGYGIQLVESLEGKAGELGISKLYLLTETVDSFFLKLGYTEIPRITAPESILKTREFAELCPDTAVCMYRELEF